MTMMNSEAFNRVVNFRIHDLKERLNVKGAEYVPAGVEDDRLHNFRRAAAARGRTLTDTLWGMQIKHLTSLSDMVDASSPNDYSYAQWNEKIGDAIAYLVLLDAIVSAEIAEKSLNTPYTVKSEPVQ